MESVDVDVEVSSKATHDRVAFAIENYRTSAIGVRLTQPLSEGVSPSQVATLSKFAGDAWTVSESALEFDHEIDWGREIETAYAVKDVEREMLEEMLAEAVVEVRAADGEEIETATGLELPSGDEPRQTGGHGDRGTDEGSATAGDRIDDASGDSEEASVASSDVESTDRDRGVSDTGPGPGTGDSRRSAVRSGENETDQPRRRPSTTNDGQVTGGQFRAGERWEKATPDEEPVETGSDDGTQLPDVPASFILEDVSDEIRPDDFLWIAIENEGRAGEDRDGRRPSPGRAEGHVDPDGSGGLFSRLRSWFS
jgi:hypothetical protein